MALFKDINEFARHVINTLSFVEHTKRQLPRNALRCVILNLLKNDGCSDLTSFDIDISRRRQHGIPEYDRYLDELRPRCVNLKSQEIGSLIKACYEDQYKKPFATWCESNSSLETYTTKYLSKDVMEWISSSSSKIVSNNSSQILTPFDIVRDTTESTDRISKRSFDDLRKDVDTLKTNITNYENKYIKDELKKNSNLINEIDILKTQLSESIVDTKNELVMMQKDINKLSLKNTNDSDIIIDNENRIIVNHDKLFQMYENSEKIILHQQNKINELENMVRRLYDNLLY
jgi:hypothetical protein